LEPEKAPDTEDNKAAESTGLGIARLYSATAGANGANGAEAEREDAPVRELTAKERQQRALAGSASDFGVYLHLLG
jgi:hypothetical protein